MAKFRTHYDNLKVSKDAPIEVIQAAYRSLARKYHPDRNASTPKNEAIMKIINASYEVLSDPVKRAKHDQWIAEQSGHSWRGPGSTPAENSEWGIPTPGDPRGGSGWQQWSVTDVMVAVAYFGTALALLRIPNLRFVAIGMLVAGWLYFRSRRR